jgi:phosphatidylinositol alpha-1,6-mannosyltransferase
VPILKRDSRTLPRRDLHFVSAGLGLEGGGRALAGRLLGGACEDFARRRGMGFRLLSLDGSGLPDGDVPVQGFAGDQRAMAVAVWKGQLRERRTAAYVFDLLGPARTQAYLPGPLRAPYLIPLYGIEVWRPLEWDRRRALSHARVVFSISRHTLERAQPYAPVAGAAVLPLALEERKPEGAVDASLLGRVGKGFLLIVGRMDPRERYKGHDQLLEALKGVDDVRLVVAGDGDDRERLEHKARALGIDDRVTFTGFLSEATIAELYRRCAAFAMPSRGEGFGLVYLEAMRAGKPVLAARGSAAEEIVVDERTGLLVDPDDREELRAALARLVDHPGEARRMGETGFDRWRKEFGIEKFRERLEPLLERLVNPHPLAPSPTSLPPAGRGGI